MAKTGKSLWDSWTLRLRLRVLGKALLTGRLLFGSPTETMNWWIEIGIGNRIGISGLEAKRVRNREATNSKAEWCGGASECPFWRLLLLLLAVVLLLLLLWRVAPPRGRREQMAANGGDRGSDVLRAGASTALYGIESESKKKQESSWPPKFAAAKASLPLSTALTRSRSAPVNR